LQIVGAEFAAARKTVAVATEAARATAAEASVATTTAMLAMTADRVPQCVKREAVVPVMAEAAVVAEAAAFTMVAMAALVAVKLVPAAMAALVAMKLVPVATAAMMAFEVSAALAAALIVTGERMPKRMQRRAVMPREETLVRATRTGKAMLMTHAGYSHLCLKMCRKIYI
jgi:hypothetical protein